ncbi:MAG: hypothetical protein KDC34_01290 [Saprospiraceae bacterium]|nr:hypothetical protein [Saprospiraceae bacterium]
MNAKRLSQWAKANPAKSWILILCLHAIMAPACFLLGVRLYIHDYILPAGFLSGLFILFTILCLFYPGKLYRKVLVSGTWRNRKIFDTAILAVSVGVMVFLGNAFPDHSRAEIKQEVMVIPIVLKEHLNTRKELRQERKTLRQYKSEWKQEIRDLRKEYRQNRQAGEGNLDVLWIILLCLAAIVVWWLLILIGCSISCNGMETLGTVVMIGGTIGVIIGLILGIRAILRHNKRGVDLQIKP